MSERKQNGFKRIKGTLRCCDFFFEMLKNLKIKTIEKIENIEKLKNRKNRKIKNFDFRIFFLFDF